MQAVAVEHTKQVAQEAVAQELVEELEAQEQQELQILVAVVVVDLIMVLEEQAVQAL
jgi:hypothetical protein